MELKTGRLHIVLVHPVIPWNTGNVGRTCLAVGAHLHLVRPLGFSLEESRVRRAGLDYWPHVELTVWPSWAELDAALPRIGEPYFFSAEGGSDVWSVRYERPAVLIFGRETEGLPPELRRRHQARLVALPMERGVVRSLNLSVAVGVAAYEAQRQWTSRPAEVPDGESRP